MSKPVGDVAKMSFERMLRRVEQFAETEHGRGATDSQIQETERSLSVSFPESYKEFLRRFGWAELASEMVYGAGEDVPKYLNVVRNRETERTRADPPLPDFLVPIMNDGAGNHYCLDTRNRSGGECPVVLWNHETKDFDKVAESFEAWLLELLDRLESE